TDEPFRVGVAIGDQVLDLAAARDTGLLTGAAAEATTEPWLNELMELGREHWVALRWQVSALLNEDARPRAELLVPMAEAELDIPAAVGDYTDFYASIFHACNVGRLFRPESPLLPNYRYVPIAYHGRASSLVPSGIPIRRPRGQTRNDLDAEPAFG